MFFLILNHTCCQINSSINSSIGDGNCGQKTAFWLKMVTNVPKFWVFATVEQRSLQRLEAHFATVQIGEATIVATVRGS